MTKQNEEWDKTIVALAYKIDQLNKEIETYKADRMWLEGRIKKLQNDNKQLKAQIGLYRIHNENKNITSTSPNEMEWGEFSEISEPTKTD